MNILGPLRKYRGITTFISIALIPTAVDVYTTYILDGEYRSRDRFWEKLQQNLEIIPRLDEFCSLGYPILLGTSRKSFLDKILGKEAKNELFGL